jgi:hypothetical protein
MICNLTESSTRDEVFVVIDNGDLELFSDIPARWQTSEVAIYAIKNAPLDTVSQRNLLYTQVPAHCRTDEFLMAAAQSGCFVLKDTKPHQTPIYRELAKKCITLSRYALDHLDPRFRDDEMLEFISSCFPNDMSMLCTHYDWLIEAMSDDLFERCCRASFFFALDAPDHRIKGNLSRYLQLDKLSGHEIVFIRQSGGLDLLALKLKEGPWPFPPSGEYMMPVEPESMEKLLERLERSDPDTPYETIYMACMMREPIDQVVPLMASNRLKKLLLEMYSAEALAPFVKTDTGLRGAMLEQAMGL